MWVGGTGRELGGKWEMIGTGEEKGRDKSLQARWRISRCMEGCGRRRLGKGISFGFYDPMRKLPVSQIRSHDEERS